jgi:hypothetical protein
VLSIWVNRAVKLVQLKCKSVGNLYQKGKQEKGNRKFRSKEKGKMIPVWIATLGAAGCPVKRCPAVQ